MWVFEDGCGVGAGVWGVRLGWWCGGGSFTTIIVDIEVIYRTLCGGLKEVWCGGRGVGGGCDGVEGGSFTTIIVDIEVIYRALCGILAPPKFHPSTT